jgi:zinc D-Ala-D-Ala carboxypeptidase
MAAISKITPVAPIVPVKAPEIPKQANDSQPVAIVPAKAGDNARPEYMAKIGDVTYRLSAGEILAQPIAPEVRCSTRRFSQARFVVVDPNAVFFAQFRKESDVTVSIGYKDAKMVEKFKGKIKNVGRVEPFGTLIIAIDNLAQLGNSAAPGTSDAGVVPPADGRKTDQDRSKRKVSKTLSYTKIEKTKLVKGAKFKDSTVYDPATLLVFSTSIPDKSTVTISIPGATEFVDAVVSAGAGGAANTLVLSEGAHAKVAALVNKDKKPFKLEVYTLPAPDPTAAAGAGKATTAEQAVLGDTKLKYSKQTPSVPAKDGGSTLQQTAGQKIVKDAAMKGDVVIAQGNTIKEISADQANQTKTALILDYRYARPAFFGEPILTVKTPLVVNSGVGTLTINGWNVNNKEGITAMAATQSSADANYSFKSFPVPGGKLNLADPIFPGCPYFWKDVIDRENGSAPDVTGLANAIKIAQLITELTEKTVGKGKRWQINSWYRTPAHNARISTTGTTGPHTHGSAVDFIFQPYDACIHLFKQYRDSHPFGVACHPDLFSKNGSGFVHLDLIPGSPQPHKRRWSYKKGGEAIEEAYFKAHPNA